MILVTCPECFGTGTDWLNLERNCSEAMLEKCNTCGGSSQILSDSKPFYDNIDREFYIGQETIGA